MTRREAERLTRQESTLVNLGFTREEAEQLRRISMTLHRWHERECGDDHGCIERDEATGKAMWFSSKSGRRWPIPDREAGAKRRLDTIMNRINGREFCRTCDGRTYLGQIGVDERRCDTCDGAGIVGRSKPYSAYIQTDPRGAALYIIRPGDVPDGKDVEAYYTRGICVY